MVMAKPFEGILGNSCELRTIEFLLPLKEMEFNITELGEEIGVTWPTISKTIKKFVEYGVMKVACKRNGTKYYQIDESSPFVLLFENLNNLLIEHMLGEEMLYQINEYRESDAPVRVLDVQCDVESWSPTPLIDEAQEWFSTIKPGQQQQQQQQAEPESTTAIWLRSTRGHSVAPVGDLNVA